MRTTLNVDNDVLARIKQLALEESVSISSVANRLLRQGLDGRAVQQPREPFTQRTFDMGKPLVDLTKAHAVLGELEDEAILAKMDLRK